MAGLTFPDPRQAMNYLKRTMLQQNRREEKRHRLLEHHQLIHNRRKNEPCVPILPGHDQESWFDKLDVNGIWETVFEYLTNPSDVTSAYFACDMFRKHLEEKRKLMMLPNVFRILREERYLGHVGFRGYVSDGIKEALKLRLVSKGWKKSIEAGFLSPVNSSLPIWYPHRWDWLSQIVCRFESIQEVDTAIENLPDTSSCACFVQLIEVDDKNCDDREMFYSKLERFLDMHGQSVWGFKFIQSRKEDQGSTKDFHYEGLCNMLNRMPYIKALCIEDHWECVDYHSEAFRAQLRDAGSRLTSIMVQKPFPTLLTLEYCCIHFYPGQMEFLVAEILSKSMNVRGVELSGGVFQRWTTAIPDFVWNALRNLRLEYFQLGYDLGSPLFLDHIVQLGQFGWPLKFLFVEHQNLNSVFDIPVSNIFRLLSSFKDSLETFLFIVTGPRYLNDPGSVVVDLPKLQEMYFVHPIEDY